MVKIKKIRYLLEAIIVYLFFAFFRMIGFENASAIGGFIAKKIGPFLKVTNIARNNLKLAFPNISVTEQQVIINDMWDNLGRTAAEFVHVYHMDSKDLLKRLSIKGLEHLEELKNDGKACIFFSGHLGNWEVTPRVFAELNYPISFIYRAANNKFVDNMICRERSKQGVTIIAKGGDNLKQIIATLKAAKPLAMLIDQKMNNGIKVPFFGHEAMTAPAIARLSINYNCPIIPLRIIRKPNCNFELEILPPMDFNNHHTKDPILMMQQINRILEKWITEYPGQWFWLHNRWPKISFKRPVYTSL